MKKILKIFAIILIVGLVISFIALASVGFDIRKLDGIELERTEYTSENEAFDKIIIDVDSADVIINSVPAGQGTRVVVEDDVDAEYEVSFDGGKLIVECEDEWRGFFNFEETTVSIYIPEGEQGKLDVEADSADVSVACGTILFRSVDIETDSGDVEGTIKAREHINISTGSGDVTLKNSSADSVSVNVESGDVDVFECSAYTARIETGSGDVEISRLAVSASLNIETSSGDVEIDSADAGSVDIATGSGDVECAFISAMNVDADAKSGEVNVRANDPSGRSCRIRTRSGDIEVTHADYEIDD